MERSTASTGWNDPDSARAYDEQMVVAIGGPMARGLVRAVPPHAGRVLEVASGTGFFSAWLLRALGPGGQVFGVDAGQAVLEVASAKKPPGLYLVQADAHDLPVRPGAFRAAYCNLGMQIFLEPDRVVREIARALRPGGGLAYAIPGRGTLSQFWSAFAERAGQPDLRDLIGAQGWAKVNSWITPDDAAETRLHIARLQAAGLRGARVEFYVEQLTFRDAEDLLSRGGFGHYNQAVETIIDESIRPEVLADVARILDRQRGPGGLTITIRALIASGWR